MSPSQINTFINQKYGKVRHGLPIYRLVWTSNLTEIRLGDYNDFSTNGSLIRRVEREAREVLKYPYDSDRWVLERWFPPEVTYNSELPHTVNGDYVDLKVFKTKEGEYLHPTLKAVEFLISFAERPQPRLTPEERINILKDKEMESVRKLLEEMTDDPEVLVALREGRGVGYDKNLVGVKSSFSASPNPDSLPKV